MAVRGVSRTGLFGVGIQRVKILAIVPARGGSKGVPGKNLKPIGGQTMTARAVQCGVDAGLPVLISTDDQSIHDEAIKAGAEGGFLRPEHLATDAATTLDVLIHGVDLWQERHSEEVEAVMILQPTSPLRSAQDVSRAVQAWGERPASSRSLASFASASHLSLGILYRVEEERAVSVAPPTYNRHLEPQLFIRNGAIYISEAGLLREGRILCDHVTPLVMDPWRSVNVDDPFDLHLAMLLAERPFVP
jgi:CMP-N,N'-diacetyllegionaminic acid synthase